MPGGYGTMEELLEITTWSQLSIHTKPVMLFNMKGYFEHLLKFIEHSIEGKRLKDPEFEGAVVVFLNFP